jgi:hypothetical protein
MIVSLRFYRLRYYFLHLVLYDATKSRWAGRVARTWTDNRCCYVSAGHLRRNSFLSRIKVQVKLSLCLTNQALCREGVWRSGRIDPYFDLGTSWRWVVSFTPLPLYPRGKRLRYPLVRRLGGPQSRSGRHGEVQILAPPRLELRTLGRPARSQSLYRLCYPGSNDKE